MEEQLVAKGPIKGIHVKDLFLSVSRRSRIPYSTGVRKFITN